MQTRGRLVVLRLIDEAEVVGEIHDVHPRLQDTLEHIVWVFNVDHFLAHIDFLQLHHHFVLLVGLELGLDAAPVDRDVDHEDQADQRWDEQGQQAHDVVQKRVVGNDRSQGVKVSVKHPQAQKSHYDQEVKYSPDVLFHFAVGPVDYSEDS